MSDRPSGELLDLAERVASTARGGEEVEAYVVRSRETEVRVFDGDVESLSMAGVEGVGVRVISDHRQGFAWAGSLETAVVDETQTGYGFSAGRAFDDLDAADAASTSAERAVRLLGATKPRTQRLPVVLDPLVTRSLLAILGSALGGESVLKNRSMFVGRDGERVAAPAVTLRDDPTLPDALGAATHDAEGVPTRRVDLIGGGVLLGYLHNAYTGRRSGAATTGSAVRGGFKSTPGVGARALHLEPGPLGPDEILAAVPGALYVQSVSGLHSGTNPVSGDLSLGAEGLLVRGGAFAEPVREVTIASSSLIADSGSSPKWTASIPTARAASTLSRLSSRKTLAPGRTPRRSHVKM